MPNRLAIYAHYDRNQNIKPFIYYHLYELQKLCDTILFVSNSPCDTTDIAKLTNICTKVLFRENTGFDFSMWQYGIESIDLYDFDTLILTNSSVYGPITELAPIVTKMSASGCDFWGMTDNIKFEWHLQSYFLVFHRTILHSLAFKTFFSSILPYKNKAQAIRSYEVGLSTYFLEQGFRPAIFAPMVWPKTNWWRKRYQDPPLSKPLMLLEQGMPYVKVALLHNNPRRCHLKPVYRAITATGFDSKLLI